MNKKAFVVGKRKRHACETGDDLFKIDGIILADSFEEAADILGGRLEKEGGTDNDSIKWEGNDRWIIIPREKFTPNKESGKDTPYYVPAGEFLELNIGDLCLFLDMAKEELILNVVCFTPLEAKQPVVA